MKSDSVAPMKEQWAEILGDLLLWPCFGQLTQAFGVQFPNRSNEDVGQGKKYAKSLPIKTNW